MIHALLEALVNALIMGMWATAIMIFYRNSQVYGFCSWMLEEVSYLAHEDIKHGREFHWRYKVLSYRNYHKMVLMFWRPLTPTVWFEDVSFLRTPENGMVPSFLQMQSKEI